MVMTMATMTQGDNGKDNNYNDKIIKHLVMKSAAIGIKKIVFLRE